MTRIVKAPYERTRVTSEGGTKTKAIQSERQNQNINNIVGRAVKTGYLPVLVGRQQVTAMPTAATYQEMMDRVVFAQQQFEQLPSEVRVAFQNDPAQLLKAIEESPNSPETTQKLEDLGIFEKSAPVDEIPAEQSSEAATGGEATE